jgi:hypothetical protein
MAEIIMLRNGCKCGAVVGRRCFGDTHNISPRVYQGWVRSIKGAAKDTKSYRICQIFTKYGTCACSVGKLCIPDPAKP